MDYFKFCLFTAPVFHWNINVIRWIKNQTDSAVIKATYLVGCSHVAMNIYEYREVNIMLSLAWQCNSYYYSDE